MCFEILFNTFKPFGKAAHDGEEGNLEVRVAMNPDFRPHFPDKVDEEIDAFLVEQLPKMWAHDREDRPSFAQLAKLFKT